MKYKVRSNISIQLAVGSVQWAASESRGLGDCTRNEVQSRKRCQCSVGSGQFRKVGVWGDCMRDEV